MRFLRSSRSVWLASRETRKICRLSIRKWMHAGDQIRARDNDDETKAWAHQPRDQLLGGDPRHASDADAPQHDDAGDEERDEPERRADEPRQALGEDGPLVEHPFVFDAGGEAIDRAGRDPQQHPDQRRRPESAGDQPATSSCRYWRRACGLRPRHQSKTVDTLETVLRQSARGENFSGIVAGLVNEPAWSRCERDRSTSLAHHHASLAVATSARGRLSSSTESPAPPA